MKENRYKILEIETEEQKQEYIKNKFLLSIEDYLMVGTLITFFGTLLANPENYTAKVLIKIAGFALLLLGTGLCFKIEQKAGYYECNECKHEYVPKYLDVVLAQQEFRTKKMTCPNCGKVTWQKKKLFKKIEKEN